MSNTKQTPITIFEKLENIYNSFSTWTSLNDKDYAVFQRLKKLSNNFYDIYAYHSGGGHCHVGLHLADGRVLLYHTVTEQCEVSHETYTSVQDYFENPDYDELLKGFGWEYNSPKYDERHTPEGSDADTNIEFINRVVVSTFTFDVEWGTFQYNGQREPEYSGKLMTEDQGWHDNLVADFSELDHQDCCDYLGSLYDIKVTRVK